MSIKPNGLFRMVTKHFYLQYVCKYMRHLFPKTVSYNRFVELERRAVVKLAILVKSVLMGKCIGISFIDSTPLRVCKNQRILQHKTFRGIAQRGKCSIGWFYGFNLHIVCNEMGEIVNFMFTPGNVDDREPLKVERFPQELTANWSVTVATSAKTCSANSS